MPDNATQDHAAALAARPSRHLGYVQIVQRGGFFAVCPACGVLDFPNRETRDEAQADITAHVEEKAAAYIRATDHLYRGRHD